MTLTPKARTLLLRAYDSGRPISTFDVVVERELIEGRFMFYNPRPLMQPTDNGLGYAEWLKEEANG